MNARSTQDFAQRAVEGLMASSELPAFPRFLRLFHVCALLTACANSAPPKAAPGEQTYAEAIALICNVDREAHIQPDDNILQIDERRTDHLQARIKNPDAIYFYTIFRTQPPDQQSASLLKESQAQNQPTCPLAQHLKTTASD
jgi:hypothetical protein